VRENHVEGLKIKGSNDEITTSTSDVTENTYRWVQRAYLGVFSLRKLLRAIIITSSDGISAGHRLGTLQLGSHVPYATSVLVASLGCLLIPTANTLPAILLYFFTMDSGLGVIICQGNTLCTWANAANPAPAINVISGGFGVGVRH